MKTWLRTAFARTPQTKAAGTNSAQIKSAPANSQLVALQLAGQARWTPGGYSALSREGYQRNAVAYRCIRMITEAAASVPLCARRAGQCLEDDPAQRLLDRPNHKHARAEFFEAYYSYLLLSGNAYLEAVFTDEETPRALFNLRPDRMKARLGKDGWPQGWDYHVAGQTRRFVTDPVTGQSLVHHMRQFHPEDDVHGFSPLEAAAKAVDVHNAGSVWTKALLDNSARPSGALVYRGAGGSERLSDEQFDRLKNELENNHAGARAAGRPLLLEGGLDWKTMSMSPSDMDFINARREAAREIALAFGVPPMLLGIPGDNTYANYKEANLAFWRQTILPLVRKTGDSLSNWLEPWFGDDLRIVPDLDDIPALASERTQIWAQLQNADFMSADEKRQIAGLPVLETQE